MSHSFTVMLTYIPSSSLLQDEFIDAFLSIPSDIIPVEFDLPSVAMGEMVACMYVALGVFKGDILNDMTFFHPQSFSSASAGESNMVQKEAKMSKKASAVARITKSMLKTPQKTVFKKDILLRIK